MLRNFIVVATGAVLAFVLALVSLRSIYSYYGADVIPINKDALDWVNFLADAVIFPGISIIVGTFVAGLVPRSRWWLAGITLLPLAAFFVIGVSHVREVAYLASYVALAAFVGFVVSRFKGQPLVANGMPNSQ